MKTELNKALNGNSKIDEIALFKEMAKIFNTNMSQCAFVEKIHDYKVEFNSCYYGKPKVVELGDLLFLTYDQSKKKIKICTMQVKWRAKKPWKFLDFNANIFQWELLRDKPLIKNQSSYNFPSNILNFNSDYLSITAFGIFYRDHINNDIDFLYTLPEYIKPKNPITAPTKKAVRAFGFRCPLSKGSPNPCCKKGFTQKEAISTCSIDMFEYQVLSWQVGAPIDDGDGEMKAWVLRFLANIIDRADNPGVITRILSENDYTASSEYNLEFQNRDEYDAMPSVMVVVTDSEKYKVCRKDVDISRKSLMENYKGSNDFKKYERAYETNSRTGKEML